MQTLQKPETELYGPEERHARSCTAAAEIFRTGHPWEVRAIDDGNEQVSEWRDPEGAPYSMTLRYALAHLGQYEIRLKPRELTESRLTGWRSLRADENWHRKDFTIDMLPDGYRPVLLGEARQPGDEYLVADWIAFKGGEESLDKDGLTKGSYLTRTKRPLPSAPEWAPLECKDILPFTLLHPLGPKDDGGWYMVQAVDPVRGILIPNKDDSGKSFWLSWANAFAKWYYQLPGEEGWHPCRKLVSGGSAQ